MKFSEMSEASKAQAIDKHRYDDVSNYEWWDWTYDDAATALGYLGFDVTETTRLPSGHLHSKHSICFSGFSSQGDGASFTGTWKVTDFALDKLLAHAPQDEELQALGARMALVLLRWPLARCSISRSGHSTHSGSMTVSEADTDPSADDESAEKDTQDYALEDMVQSIARDAADWVYGRLEAEHDYLTSDDAVAERLAEDDFDENDYTRAEPLPEVVS